ncbi:MAG: hypothetical protein ILM98_07730 [Kiritimatiellae bacterium]|nr:hypothetical protein [Kiritimatiellia bacterium]
MANESRDVTWDFPRLGSCHEGIAFGDGRTGVLVWGGGEEIRLTIGRADLWDHRGGYPWTQEQNYENIVSAIRAGDEGRLLDLFKKETPEGEPRNPYMLPLGRVIVKVPGKTLVRGALDPFTGLGSIDFAEGGSVSLAMSNRDGGTFAMKFPDGIAFEASAVPATDFPVYGEKLKPLGFEMAEKFEGAGRGTGGFCWSLPADPPVSLAFAKHGAELTLRTWRGGPSDAAEVLAREDVRHPVSFEKARADSEAYWAAFWAEGARVKVPDPVIQRVFDYGMYRFGAMTDPDGVPAGLQGVWLEDDRLVPWNGDYHFNINVQECYSPAYRGGHFRNLLPLFRMVLSWRPRLRDNARKFAGVEKGYSLPHSVDDRGVCIGGFWTGTIDHGSTAWVAAMMMRYVRYSGDIAFLRDGAYDFMKGAMVVYRALMEERDGVLSIPFGPSPEWGGSNMANAVGRDPTFQLAAAHRLARDLIDAARILGEEPEEMWLDVERRLPPCSAGEKGIQLFKGQDLTESHRHHSHMAGFYPFNTLDLSSSMGRENAAATYKTWVEQGTGKWAGWSLPWASILNTHFGNAQAAAELLRAWDAYFCNPGHGSLHNAYAPGFSTFTISGSFAGSGNGQIMQMDGQCAAAAAVLEMMAHEVNGKVEFFRGCPESWREVSFENLALSNGRRISARRVGGKFFVEKFPQ